MVARLVGFWEYMLALKHSDELVKQSTAEELELYDKLVRDRNEFAVYTNLSRKEDRGIGSSLIADTEPGDTSERRGLAWVTALARVELGAMLAAFTDISTPFEVYPSTPFDRDAYQDLILDGARSHYWALNNDSRFRKVVRGTPDKEMLAYLRRLGMTRKMVSAAASAGDYTAPQYQELKTWHQQLETFEAELALKIKTYLDSPEVVDQREYEFGVGYVPILKTGTTFSDLPFNRHGGGGLIYEILRTSP
jgi:hypothetical protein